MFSNLHILELLRKSIEVQSLDDYFAIAVTTTTKELVYFEKIRPGSSSVDSVIMKAWVNYYDNCITVDFLKNETVRQGGISTIWIDVLKKRYNTSLMATEIIPVDRNLFTDRTLKNTKLFYNGPNIALEKGASDGAYDDYILEIKQDTYMENDPSKNCKKYPNQKFESYNHCDKDFTLRTLAKHYGPGFVPFWATDDLDNVTRSQKIDWSYDFGPLYDGTTTSDCPLPCTTNSVNAKLISRKQVFKICIY